MNEGVSGFGPNISQESTWKLQKSEVPFLPNWAFLRQNISKINLNPKLETFVLEKNSSYSPKYGLKIKFYKINILFKIKKMIKKAWEQ